MEQKDTGILLNKKDISLHRAWFTQMTKLLGINVLYRAPREGKKYDTWGELDSNYYPPIVVGCIFNDNVDQKTAKKMGWNAELNESTTLITVPYDLEKLQVGALFIIPSGLDDSQGRLFKVLKMQVIPIYPATITCELGPVLEDRVPKTEVMDFTKSNFNLLVDEED